MNPYHELNLTTRNRIIGLIKQCEISNLGNVAFEYYPRPSKDGKRFSMTQNNLGWEIIVSGRRSGTRDMYMIVDGQIKHDYSEKD